MSVKLEVKDLRREIRRQQQGPTSSSTLSAIPGSIFDETVATLLGNDPALNFLAAIDEVEPSTADWVRALTNHTYHRLVGPRLQQHQALLHQLSDQVLTMWDAVQEMCRWLAGNLLRSYQEGDEDLSRVVWVRAEDPVTLELSLPGWSESLLLHGETGPAWYSPLDRQWITLTMTTGTEGVEDDLAATALTQMLLRAAGEIGPNSDAGLRRINFSPSCTETIHSSVELRGCQDRLIQLAGKLTGVAAGVTGAVRQVEPALPAETDKAGQRLIAILRELGASPRIDSPAIIAASLIRFSVTVEDRRRAGGLDRLALEIQVQFGLATPPLLGFDGERLLIDLPRPDRREVTFDEIRDEIPSANPVSGSAQAPLGVDVDGHLRLIDFSRPEDAHLLIAGRSGSGKTEWLRTAIAGLTQANTPETLQLILVDLAGEAFPAWRESPFLHSPLINTTDLAIETLSALGDEMERRHLLMRQLGIDSVGAGLAGKSDRPIPRIFFVCDEYTDLISGNRQKRQLVERQISRLGQRARAAGIHLVIATRHTRREIIRGLLDSTFPARIGLQMGKGIESKMLLNQAGAERLLGQGDLLFRDGGSLVRLQGARVRPGSYPE